MRGASKTSTNGQYFSAVHSGNWGIYAMNSVVPITKKTKIPPYIDAFNTLAPSVAFYNVNCSTVESFNQMLAADQGSGYSITPGKNEVEVTYVKNTGTRKRLRHGGHPILTWNAENTQVYIDQNENYRPVKGRNNEKKIDGIMATIDALSRAMLNEVPYYEHNRMYE